MILNIGKGKKFFLTSCIITGGLLFAGTPRGITQDFAKVDGHGTFVPAVYGVGNAGVLIAKKDPKKDKFESIDLAIDDFGADQGWDSSKHLRLTSSSGAGSMSGGFSIFGFGNKGVTASLKKVEYINGELEDQGYSSPKLMVGNFGYNQGWRRDRHLRQVVDITGDYVPDVVGFGNKGVLVSEGKKECKTDEYGYEYDCKLVRFDKSSLLLKDFGYDQGWHNDTHLRFATGGLINADDYGSLSSGFGIVGFGNKGVSVSLYDKNKKTFTKPTLWLKDFGTNQGWDNDKNLRMLRYMEPWRYGGISIVGFGNKGVSVAKQKTNGGGFEKPRLVLKNFGTNQGWSNQKHLRLVADMTADGAPDIVGFGGRGVYVSEAITKCDDYGCKVTGYKSPKLVVKDFGYNQGWRNDKTIRIIADVTGDYVPDIVGFGKKGVLVSKALVKDENVWPREITGYSKPQLWLENFGSSQGWSNEPQQQKQQ